MSQIFDGDLLLPGEAGPGLSATFELDGGTITMTVGDDHLGSWQSSAVLVQRDRNGAFLMTLGGEDLYFTPQSPAEFATAVTVPLQAEAPKPESKRERKKRRREEEKESGAGDQPVREVQPPRPSSNEDDIITGSMFAGIVVLAVVLVIAALGVIMFV